jgi:hypothetical protein
MCSTVGTGGADHGELAPVEVGGELFAAEAALGRLGAGCGLGSRGEGPLLQMGQRFAHGIRANRTATPGPGLKAYRASDIRLALEGGAACSPCRQPSIQAR